MIETDIIEYLSNALDAPVYAERPVKPPDEFIIIEKTAGNMKDFIEFPTLAIQSYAPTMLKSARLNEQVKKAMLEAAVIPRVGYCRLNSDYNFTDTSRKEYRYQAVYNLSYK